MEEGLLSLKWNNHKSTFFQVLSVLREKHTYTDVTLACDGRLYPAHKFVLSTCSEYFSDIFTSTSGTSIVIVLKDVRRQDLEYLMDYMYLGQVDVAQSELPSLIKTAECLRIKGLAIPDDEPHKTQRRGVDEREGSPPPSKKKRYLQEDDRHPAASNTTTNNNNNTTITSSSSSTSGRIQMEVLPQPDLGSLVQHLRQVPHPQQPLQAPPPPPPTSQGSNKSHSSHPLTLNLTTQASRSSQGGSSGTHVHTPTSTSTPSSHRPHSSPSHTTPVPVIKEEAADPPETPEGYLNESFEENETKPDVSDPRHLDPDGAVPGPSGLQGSDNWDGDGEMGGYGGGDGYPEGSLEEHGESEVQGAANVSRTPGMHHPPPHPLEPHITQNSLGTTSSFPQLTHEATTQRSLLSGSSSNSMFASSLSGNIALNAQIEASDGLSQDFLNSLQQMGSLTSDGLARLVCPYCGKISRCLSHLQTHVRVHTGERPYACSFCSFRTTQKVALKEHIYTHTGEKPHMCPYCDFKCAKKCNLNSHIRRHHNMPL